MKIGLVRHFKVNINPGEGWINSSEFRNSMNNYDKADVTANRISISQNEWDLCFSSTLPRAIKTAQTIYIGEIIKTDLLIEVPMFPFTKKEIFFPAFVWHIGARYSWLKNKSSQPEGKIETENRVKKFLEYIYSYEKERILVVTHGFFMKAIFAELFKRGFKGKTDIGPKNGKLYVLSDE